MRDVTGAVEGNEPGRNESAESGSAPTRVLVVGDHPVVRTGLARLLAMEPDLEICGEAADVAEALKEVEVSRPDVVIVDLSLEDGSGLDIIARLARTHPELGMLVCSVYDDLLYGERALQAGAHGYVQKGTATPDVVEATREVAAGRLAISERLRERVAGTAAQAEAAATPLSRRERQVLDQIGKGKTVQEIAYDLNLSTKTVETYRDRLRKKLELSSSARLVYYAMVHKSKP